MTLAVLPPVATTAGGRRVFSQTSILATNVIAIGHVTTPFITAYPWSAGFGSKYADPATTAGANGQGVSFAPNGSAVAMGRSSAAAANITAYPWSSGFGTRYQGATVTTGLNAHAAFSPDSAYIAGANSNISHYLPVWPWSSSGFGTRVSDPATPPTGTTYGVVFRPNNDAIVAAHATSPYVSAYPWSSSGFGTKYSDPGVAIASTGQAVWFTANGSDLAVAHANSPYLSVYPWSSGFGTKYGNPASVPSGQGVGVAFTRAGTAIAAALNTSPYVAAYAWSSSGFGTKYSDPGTAIGGIPGTNTGNKIAFAVDDSAVAIVHATSPYVSAYPWDVSSGFGTKYSDPGSAIAGTGQGVAFGTMFT